MLSSFPLGIYIYLFIYAKVSISLLFLAFSLFFIICLHYFVLLPLFPQFYVLKELWLKLVFRVSLAEIVFHSIKHICHEAVYVQMSTADGKACIGFQTFCL